MSDRTEIPGTSVRLRGSFVARVTGTDDQGHPLISPDGSENRSERAAVVVLPSPVDWGRAKGCRVLAVRPDGLDGGSIVLGLIDPLPPDPAEEARRLQAEELQALERETAALHRTIECDRELVLRCGEAKIVLRADGRIEISGNYVLSRSTGVHKIRGGSVQIN